MYETESQLVRTWVPSRVGKTHGDKIEFALPKWAPKWTTDGTESDIVQREVVEWKCCCHGKSIPSFGKFV